MRPEELEQQCEEFNARMGARSEQVAAPCADPHLKIWRPKPTKSVERVGHLMMSSTYSDTMSITSGVKPHKFRDLQVRAVQFQTIEALHGFGKHTPRLSRAVLDGRNTGVDRGRVGVSQVLQLFESQHSARSPKNHFSQLARPTAARILRRLPCCLK